MTTLKTVTVGEKTGTVFFDDEWDAYGWKTEDFTNGPYDTAEDAEEALREELTTKEDERYESALASDTSDDLGYDGTVNA